MGRRATRKNQRGGGDLEPASIARIQHSMGRIRKVESQIKHTACQLLRFIGDFKKGDMSRRYQFGYNLGRLQELCFETTHPETWWKPIDARLTAAESGDVSAWGSLETYIHELCAALEIVIDADLIGRGCKTA